MLRFDYPLLTYTLPLYGSLSLRMHLRSITAHNRELSLAQDLAREEASERMENLTKAVDKGNESFDTNFQSMLGIMRVGPVPAPARAPAPGPASGRDANVTGISYQRLLCANLSEDDLRRARGKLYKDRELQLTLCDKLDDGSFAIPDEAVRDLITSLLDG